MAVDLLNLMMKLSVITAGPDTVLPVSLGKGQRDGAISLNVLEKYKFDI